MLDIAIVGCGKIADAHATQIARIGGAKVVAVCDREPLMAMQLAERFAIPRSFSDLDELLGRARPHVIHITTPPASHFALAKLCLNRGCHVYVEKPFTVNAREADILLTLATEKGLKITVGHDDQFTHVARRMRSLVEEGYLGGRPLHMESHYCYDLAEPGYAKALLGDKEHWVRALPGRLLHNIISHGVARIAEFLATESPRVIAHGFVSPLLRAMNERDIVDELRVIVSEDQRTTAYFTFSSQMRPSLHQFRVYGRSNGLMLDHDNDSLIKLPGRRHTSYNEKFLPSLSFARQHLGNFATNLNLFLRRDFHMKSGMKFLIESFYRSITQGGPEPIPYREIILTARIMDEIFGQISSRESHSSDTSHVLPVQSLAETSG